MTLEANNAWIGYTEPGTTNWQTYTGPDPETSGLYVDVDFADAGFLKVPYLTANLVGEIDTWVMQLSISQITETSARIYIKSTVVGFVPTPAMAAAKQWSVVFWAAPPKGPYTLPPYTFMTYPCDNA
jgi:hypothetical protein